MSIRHNDRRNVEEDVCTVLQDAISVFDWVLSIPYILIHYQSGAQLVTCLKKKYLHHLHNQNRLILTIDKLLRLYCRYLLIYFIVKSD